MRAPLTLAFTRLPCPLAWRAQAGQHGGMSRQRFIITRPAEDAARFIAAARSAGADVVAMPVIGIRFHDDAPIPARDFQAVAITSANGARAIARRGAREREHLGRALALTVGPASSAAARNAGFARIMQAEGGDVAALIELAKARLRPADGPILYASGAVTRGDLEQHLGAAGFEVHRAVLYEARPATTLNDAARKALTMEPPGTVALYSPRSARIWARLVREAGLAAEAARWRHACLSANVARALDKVLPEAGEVMIAPHPREEAMLQMLGLPEQAARMEKE